MSPLKKPQISQIFSLDFSVRSVSSAAFLVKSMMKSNFVSLSLVIFAAACWGMSGIFINLVVANYDISAWGLAFWREMGTAALLFVGLRWFRPDLLRVAWHDVPWLALMGALSIGLFHAMWNASVLINGTAVATVFQYNAPIFVAIAAWFLWREPLTWRKAAAIGLAFLGTILVSRFDWQTGTQITVQGGLVGLGTAVAFSGLALFGKKLSGSYSSWTILLYTFSFGALALLPFQAGRPYVWPAPLAAAIAFAGLVVVSTIGGFAAYTIGLRRIQASVAVIVATVEVPLAAIASYLFLGEQLDGRQVAGAALVVSGVVLLSLPQKGGEGVDDPGRGEDLPLGLSPHLPPGSEE